MEAKEAHEKLKEFTKDKKELTLVDEETLENKWAKLNIIIKESTKYKNRHKLKI